MMKIPRYKMESLNLIKTSEEIKEQDELALFKMKNKKKKRLKSKDFKVENVVNLKELMMLCKKRPNIQMKNQK